MSEIKKRPEPIKSPQSGNRKSIDPEKPTSWWGKRNKNEKILAGLGVCCLGIILIVGIGGILSPDAPSPEIAETVPTEEDAPTVDQGQATTTGQEQAAKKAESYLSISAFSRQGLIEQLEYEGFTRQQAEYGVDQTGADWNEQAAKKAESYLSISAFSRQGLIEQLEYEGFTRQQAEYGVRAVGL
ncbi:MAG: Ltp family lipoprotein [Methanobacterium sp.]|nr:Ltp family lipoprotein [Methanobacterium sp.]MBV1754870.1 Ltp family lipoprotein [Methanobacterium sp.]